MVHIEELYIRIESNRIEWHVNSNNAQRQLLLLFDLKFWLSVIILIFIVILTLLIEHFIPKLIKSDWRWQFSYGIALLFDLLSISIGASIFLLLIYTMSTCILHMNYPEKEIRDTIPLPYDSLKCQKRKTLNELKLMLSIWIQLQEVHRMNNFNRCASLWNCISYLDRWGGEREGD